MELEWMVGLLLHFLTGFLHYALREKEVMLLGHGQQPGVAQCLQEGVINWWGNWNENKVGISLGCPEFYVRTSYSRGLV
jgi:hypothetical protein